jgi:NAD(P)-dependent dehydrogenase (short-subunit alcohol dehydrogenase family)
MAGKVVLITGASSGIGRASAEHLSSLGHRVYGTSRKAVAPDEAGPAEFPVMIPMDVCDDESVDAAINYVLNAEGRIDVVVNNAGLGCGGAVEDTTVDEARAIFDTNFFGVHRVCRAVLPTLRGKGSGTIVNISSLGGLVTIPFQGFYSASKFALESMSDALRMELVPFGVSVVLVEPGDFKTSFTESRRFAAATGSESPYDERCMRAVGVMEKDERNGADPQQVAELLAKIVDNPKPHPRYTAGSRSQSVSVALRRILPSAAMDRILRAVYKV